MILTEQHIINKGNKKYKNLDNLCFLSKNLYNYSLFIIKSKFEETGKWIRYNELEKELRQSKQIDYISLPNNSSQQILMILDNNLKSFFNSLKEFKKTKTKFNSCPKFPKFKDKLNGRNIVLFTSNQFRIKDNYIYFPKKSNIKPFKIKTKDKIKQVRIIPKINQYVIEIIYEIFNKTKILNNNYLSIDLGINNLATCTNNIKTNSFIINGKPLKSINQYYNKKKGYYQSQLKKNHNKNTSNRINKLTIKRNNKIKNYLHKCSKFIVSYCKENYIDNVVLGKNIGWKDKINLGKKTNQSFVSIPFNNFESYLRYKLQKEGLNLIIKNEAYTSKCSALDKEKIQKHKVYLGNRIHRGLFKTQTKIINADVNGSLNILRKEIGDNFINEIVANIGLVDRPVKINLYKIYN